MTALRSAWSCADCDAAGEGPDSDRAADKHTRTARHSTRVWTAPEETT